MPYRVIVADPPWRYHGDVAKGYRADKPWKGVATPYPTLSIDQIAGMNVGDFADTDAYLFLWITNTHLLDPQHPAHRVATSWGFRPITVVTWVKHQQGQPMVPSRKVGAYFRGASEHVVFAVRGRLPMRAAPATWFGTPRTKHSEKPDEFYHMVEDVAEGPYLDVFARTLRPGWSCWGNEVADPSAPDIHVPD